MMTRFVLTAALAAGCLCAILGCKKEELPKQSKDSGFQAKPLAEPRSPGEGAGGGVKAGKPGGGPGAD
jgi:hypothetical protein